MNLNSVKTVGFIGDSHAQWKDLYAAIEKLKNADMIIQVGDFGYWSPLLKSLSLNRPVYFIPGNHEDYTLLKTNTKFDICEVQECHPNLFFIPRGTVLEIGNRTFGFMGGAYSVDKAQRRVGIDWFPEELPSYAEYMRLFAYAGKIDVLVTHDAPTKAIENTNVLRFKNDTISQGNRQVIQQLCDQFTPKNIFFGHYHTRIQTQVDNTFAVGLACAPDCVILDTTTMRISNA